MCTAFRACVSLGLIGAVCAKKGNVDSWSGGCAPLPHAYRQIRVYLRMPQIYQIKTPVASIKE